jgi:hypothetical protein
MNSSQRPTWLGWPYSLPAFTVKHFFVGGALGQVALGASPPRVEVRFLIHLIDGPIRCDSHVAPADRHFWIATSWLATGLYVAPAVSGVEPKGNV